MNSFKTLTYRLVNDPRQNILFNVKIITCIRSSNKRILPNYLFPLKRIKYKVLSPISLKIPHNLSNYHYFNA